MAKLEKVCRDKLTIKDVRPVMCMEDSGSVSSSSTSEKTCSYPGMLVTSLSEPDLGRLSSLSTMSDEELPNLEKKTSRGTTMMTYAEELINNMWNGFSVEDYIQYESDVHKSKKTRKKPKSWAPRVTVPVPFQMMVREQKRKEKTLKAKSDLEMKQNLLKKEEDEAECKKKFQANPIPSCLLLPLYEELVRQNEERRRNTKETSKAALLASQKPFKFIEREERKQAARKKQLRDFLKSKRKTKWFKARPVPHSVYRPAANEKSEEEELYRNIRGQLTPQELLQNPLWPHGLPCKQRRDSRSPGKPRLRHRCRCLSPKDGNFAAKQEEPFSAHGIPKHSTLSKPCDSTKTQKDRTEEENLKEKLWPYLSPRHKSPVRGACTKPRPWQCTPPTPTVSSLGREQAVRKSLEEKKMLEEERNRILTKQKQRMKELQKLVATRAKAYDSHESLSQMLKSRVNSLRKSEKARMTEYRQEVEERDEKLQKRPMLFERIAQRNARMAAEKHYSNTLTALGLSEEFVSKKGQSGKVSENFTRQELRSCTLDKESSYVEERENEEENYFIDTNSRASCKENKEDVKESDEENSGE